MINDILTYFQNKKWYRDRIEHIEEIPARRARYTNHNVKLPTPLEDYLNKHEITLYTHQYEALKYIRQKENVVITTPTASGKTLSFTLPVLEDLTNNKNNTALYIYPTKALANDQLKSILNIDKECMVKEIEDGTGNELLKPHKLIIVDNNQLTEKIVNNNSNMSIMAIHQTDGSYFTVLFDSYLEDSMFTKLYLESGMNITRFNMTHSAPGISVWNTYEYPNTSANTTQVVNNTTK